ncbi:hypothetical protein, partial [Lapillicoccus sp.]|uniref:hypothetical protein n=1 Tax=Lapillicoccus sp. TaxID=1909287 RepID=UPI0025F89FB4
METAHPSPPVPLQHPQRSPVPSPDWQLFLDWCTAAGHDALPTTPAAVTAFLNDIPAGPSTQRRRVRAIRNAHVTAGHLSPADPRRTAPTLDPADPPADPAGAAVRSGAGWLTPEQALTHLPVDLWPHGLHARRDAVLLLLLGPLRHTKVQALHATARTYPLPGIGTTDLTTAADPRTCPACVLTRWLTVLTATTLGGRFAAEEVVVGSRRGGPRGGHDCLDDVEDGWQRYPLLPSIDQHGWISDTALTPRSLAAIISGRQGPSQTFTTSRTAQAPANTPARASYPSGRLAPQERPTAILKELDELLDRLETESTQLRTRLGDAL